MQPNLLQQHRKKRCFFESQNAAPPFSALIADHAQFSLAKFFLVFIWARLRSVVCPCERVWAGVGFFRQVGGFERSGSLGPGLGPVCVGLKPGLRVRLCHERLRVRRGRTVARAPLALFYRQRPPGLSGPAARSTQEHCCFCERDDFASTCSRRRSTSGQLQKTVLNPVDSGRARA